MVQGHPVNDPEWLERRKSVHEWTATVDAVPCDTYINRPPSPASYVLRPSIDLGVDFEHYAGAMEKQQIDHIRTLVAMPEPMPDPTQFTPIYSSIGGEIDRLRYVFYSEQDEKMRLQIRKEVIRRGLQHDLNTVHKLVKYLKQIGWTTKDANGVAYIVYPHLSIFWPVSKQPPITEIDLRTWNELKLASTTRCRQRMEKLAESKRIEANEMKSRSIKMRIRDWRVRNRRNQVEKYFKNELENKPNVKVEEKDRNTSSKYFEVSMNSGPGKNVLLVGIPKIRKVSEAFIEQELEICELNRRWYRGLGKTEVEIDQAEKEVIFKKIGELIGSGQMPKDLEEANRQIQRYAEFSKSVYKRRRSKMRIGPDNKWVPAPGIGWTNPEDPDFEHFSWVSEQESVTEAELCIKEKTFYDEPKRDRLVKVPIYSNGGSSSKRRYKQQLEWDLAEAATETMENQKQASRSSNIHVVSRQHTSIAPNASSQNFERVGTSD
ncbi:hypothetical protein B0O99DRAFT_206080 [Bisporella sp. PMI_857]|nr:hypothetical protein B0O99DRAFT_206080 [Bisporella sp. PMI_857]